MDIKFDKEELAAELRGSLLKFTAYFFKVLTSRDFIISQPMGRESHHVTIAKALTQAFRLELPTHRLLINTPPGSGKSLLMQMFVAWTMAQYPDSKHIYVSYSKVLSDKNTEMIKRIMMCSQYEYLFDVQVRKDSKAKDYFQTTSGGAVASAGSSGTITGISAGEPGLNRYSGSLIVDDLHNAVDVHSSTIRDSVINNFSQTLQQRLRSIKVPLIVIGQRLHEGDISNHLISKKDGYEYTTVILKAIDGAGNVIYPEVYSREMLLKRQQTDPYVFSSQYQQEPIPAGGALYKPDWFILLDVEPTLLYSFVVADTAETSKSYNDATALGFFGVYKLEDDSLAVHVIDTLELRIEPHELKDAFMDFWSQCMRHKCKPKLAAIEKKSTGVTLLSLLKEMRGIRLLDIQRTRESGSKTKRFLDIQPLIAERRVSLLAHARNTNSFINHMVKITANESHAHDDLADIVADSLRLALIDKSIISASMDTTDYNSIGAQLTSHDKQVQHLKQKAYANPFGNQR
jgi:predicted phage terminase large subunit-like protein